MAKKLSPHWGSYKLISIHSHVLDLHWFPPKPAPIIHIVVHLSGIRHQRRAWPHNSNEEATCPRPLVRVTLYVHALLRTHRQRWGTRSSHRFNLESRSDPVCIYWGRHMPRLLYAQSTNQSTTCLLCTRASSWLWCIHTARKQTRKPGTSYHHHIRLLSCASPDIHPPLPPDSPCRATNTTTT